MFDIELIISHRSGKNQSSFVIASSKLLVFKFKVVHKNMFQEDGSFNQIIAST